MSESLGLTKVLQDAIAEAEELIANASWRTLVSPSDSLIYGAPPLV